MERQTTIKVIDFHPKHMEVMEIRDIEKYGILSLEDISERMESVHEVCTEAGTFLYDGRVLCCAGLSIMWPGVADIWVIPSKHVHTAGFTFSKWIRRYLDDAIVKHKLHRLQTACVDDALHTRWMGKWLGFTRQNVLTQYTHDKQDRVMWERIIE